MIRAAGILFITTDNRALFLKRGPGDHAGEFCFPGGTLERNESTEQTAIRETKEEIGFMPEYLPQGGLIKHAVTVAPTADGTDQVEFTTYIQRIADIFEPRLNPESVGFAWAPVTEPPEPLHPGCRVALQKLSMHELDVAKAIRDGQLASPQQFENMWLFAMRISGTGVAFRKKLNEYVVRRPENYLSEEFLQRCAALSIIVQHPKGDKLDSQEFAERIVGVGMLVPWIKGDEVWGIAKIYDQETAEMLSRFQLSTSPAVVLFSGAANTRFGTEDGKTVLFEGKPKLLDHLAICEVGVWDKGQDPSGVAVEAIGDDQMAEEDKKTEDKDMKGDRKSDGEIDLAKEKGGGGSSGEQLDKMLTGLHAKLDDCLKKMDSMSSRMDAMETEHKKDRADAHRDDKKDDSHKRDDKHRDDDDAHKKDAKKRDDDARDDKHKDDAHRDDKKDAEEEKEKGESKEVVADKKRKDDDDDSRKDKRKDDDMKKDSKADSDGDIRKAIADLETKLTKTAASIPAQMSDADYHALADAQETADRVFTAWGQRAPIPLRGEARQAYDVRLASQQQKHSKTWKDVDLKLLSPDAFKVAQRQIYADSLAAAASPDSVEPGMLRPHRRVMESGHVEYTFTGSPHSWMSHFARGRSRFLTKINPKPEGN